MTAAARKTAARPSALGVFVARAEARVILWTAGEISLHEAVDELWAAAVRNGLVAKLGADKGQQLLADIFAKVRSPDECKPEIPARGVEALIAGLKLCADTQRHLAEWESRKAQPAEGLSSTFAAACRKADEKQRRKPPDPRLEKLRRLLDDDVSLERAWEELNKPTDHAAASTVEALMFSLRERGVAALAEAETRRRLAALSTTQVQVILARLMALRPTYPAIDDELLFLLGEQLR
jgi:hypothetical protein